MIIRCGVSGICLFFFILLMPALSVAQSHIGEIRCICIDPGHGGEDPGAIGLKSYEKTITLNLALKVGKLIKAQYPEMKIVYTRDKDVSVGLKERTKIANDGKADLFISIHINSSNNRNAKGVETFVLGSRSSDQNLQVAMRENAVIKYEEDYTIKYAGFDPTKAESYIIFNMVRNVHLEKSLEFASIVQNEMVQATGKRDREVTQDAFWVLKDAAMPAILVEACFISNQEEERYLNTNDGQNKITNAIFQAFKTYKNNEGRNSALLTNKNSAGEEEKKDTVNTFRSDGLFYAVQVASAQSKISDLKRIGITEQITEICCGNRYRYYVGESDDYDKVKEVFGKVKQKIRDCFIIAIYKGNVISVAEARKMKSEK